MADFAGMSGGLILVTFPNRRGTMLNYGQVADRRNVANE